MSFLLDSNAIIAILGGKPESVRNRWQDRLAAGASVATSSIVMFELRFGAHKSARRKHNLARLDRLLASPLNVIAFDAGDADVAGEIRAALERKGQPIGPYDLLIASQAMRHGSTLVTANTREFHRVKGLNVENWELP